MLSAAGQSSKGVGAATTALIRQPPVGSARKFRLHSSSAKRFFGATANKIADTTNSSSPAADACKYGNQVEESIKKLMTTSRDNDVSKEEKLKPISNEDIEVRLDYFRVRSFLRWFLFVCEKGKAFVFLHRFVSSSPINSSRYRVAVFD